MNCNVIKFRLWTYEFNSFYLKINNQIYYYSKIKNIEFKKGTFLSNPHYIFYYNNKKIEMYFDKKIESLMHNNFENIKSYIKNNTYNVEYDKFECPIKFPLTKQVDGFNLLNKEEEDLINEIYILLEKNNISIDKVKVMKKSKDYLTLTTQEEDDILRFKLTDRTKWISILITYEDRKKEINNPLFNAQKNKKQLFWKANILNYSDIIHFGNFIIKAYNYLSN